jgi:hypothetical protein
MSEKAVFNVLELDSQARNKQNKTVTNNPFYDLWLLKDINFNNDWDYSLPTIYSNRQFDKKSDIVKDIEDFKILYNTEFSRYMSEVDYNNILIAGGAPTSILLQEKWGNDIDIFIYGLTVQAAKDKVKTLIQQIYKSNRLYLSTQHSKDNKNNGEDSGKKKKKNNKNPINDDELKGMLLKEEEDDYSIRNKYAITLVVGTKKIQIILRLYKSISEILHGFDLGSSAVGYDGNQLYFTTLGRFSYEYFANIVDPSRRSTTYERRLMKYYGRGFDIILPYLDINKLSTSYLKYGMGEVAELPYFTFTYNQVRGNKIKIGRVIRNSKLIDNSDYQQEDLDEYAIFYINLRNIAKNDDNYYYFNRRDNLNILTNPPYISAGRVIDYYDKLADRIYSDSKFDAKIFNMYFSIELLPQVLTDIFLNKNMDNLHQLIETQKQIVLQRLDAVQKLNHSDIQFIVDNPGTQLTGSFNPIISNIADWYGPYMVDSSS